MERAARYGSHAFLFLSFQRGTGRKRQIMEKDITPNSLKSVFKFYSLTDYNLDAFLNHYLFTSHPYHLNDLMDGNHYCPKKFSQT